MKSFLPFLLLLIFSISLTAQEEESEYYYTDEEIAAFEAYFDSLANSLEYQYGEITLGSGLGVATINIPEGYKFLDAEQSDMVLTELWGNPHEDGGLGMLFKKNETPISENFSYAIEITYVEDGYIDDSDASDIDYDELLTDMLKDT